MTPTSSGISLRFLHFLFGLTVVSALLSEIKGAEGYCREPEIFCTRPDATKSINIIERPALVTHADATPHPLETAAS